MIPRKVSHCANFFFPILQLLHTVDRLLYRRKVIMFKDEDSSYFSRRIIQNVDCAKSDLDVLIGSMLLYLCTVASSLSRRPTVTVIANRISFLFSSLQFCCSQAFQSQPSNFNLKGLLWPLMRHPTCTRVTDTTDLCLGHNLKVLKLSFMDYSIVKLFHRSETLRRYLKQWPQGCRGSLRTGGSSTHNLQIKKTITLP